jgi:hypothetical protein
MTELIWVLGKLVVDGTDSASCPSAVFDINFVKLSDSDTSVNWLVCFFVN